MALPPVLTPEQRAAALAKATTSRRTRALAKSKVREGSITISEILDLATKDEAVAKMRVLELLESIPGLGRIRALAILEKLGISTTRKLQGLGIHQRSALREEFSHSVTTAMSASRGRLIVLSGPGGVGKSTVANALRKSKEFSVSVSATTRQPRASERDGVDYFFISQEEFDRRIAADEFLEWAAFAGARYGTPAAAVEEALSHGRNVLLEIEIEGARQVRAHSSEAILVFLQPPTWEDLVSRLEGRGSDTPERRAQRLELAQTELAAAKEFDIVLVNDEVEKVVDALLSLARTSRS